MAKNHLTPVEFDSRMIEWNLRHGNVTKENLFKHLAALPDDGANSELIHIEDENMDVGVFQTSSDSDH